jgi:hypothetical protein
LPELRRRLRSLKIEISEERTGESPELEEYHEVKKTQDAMLSLGKEATPEYAPIGFLESADQVLRRDLRAREIVPPGISTADQSKKSRWRGSSTFQEIREAITEALLREMPLCLNVARGKGLPSAVHTVYPICWGPEPGRFSFYARDSGGVEMLWHLDDILSARVVHGGKIPDR